LKPKFFIVARKIKSAPKTPPTVAAAAMIFGVVEEVIPESQQNGNGDLATTGTVLGFALMMFLDVAFGK